jgi:FlaA1/EpsC-like NDP-sugar epimerase
LRNRYIALIDLVLLTAGTALALVTALGPGALRAPVAGAALTYAATATTLRLVVAWRLGLYSAIWQYAGAHELQRLLLAGAVGGVATVLAGGVGLPLLVASAADLPFPALLVDALLATGAFVTPRLAMRLHTARRSPRTHAPRRALLVGAGAAGQALLRDLQSHPSVPIEVVAVADDDRAKQGKELSGVPVVGPLDRIPDYTQKLGLDEVLIAMPSAPPATIRRVLDAARAAGIAARTLPSLTDLVAGRVQVSALREVKIEDLLRRAPVETDLAAVAALIHGRTVLVTGAGGSIGAELSRQIAAIGPARLVLLDHNENGVFEIEQELRGAFPGVALGAVVADVRDRVRLQDVFDHAPPFAVFHAAAHKHVPLMEENVAEAVTNNILGTRALVDAALAAETPHLVFISTDKAVKPTSVMGATKRIGERIVHHAAVTHRRHFVSVRFGNVLGSRGSVVPIFLEQIRRGGPVTVTHPEMRRYFMTIPEATQLVLQAAAMGTGGELFVLDMGEPVRIVDLAQDLIRLAGYEPGTDIRVEFTGVRPGEKLYEEVFFAGEDVEGTAHPKILKAKADAVNEQVLERIDLLVRSVLAEHEEAKVRELLSGLVSDTAPLVDGRRPTPQRLLRAE